MGYRIWIKILLLVFWLALASRHGDTVIITKPDRETFDMLDRGLLRLPKLCFHLILSQFREIRTEQVHHTNCSTKSTRNEGGYEVIKKATEKLGLRHKEHIAANGEGNERED